MKKTLSILISIICIIALIPSCTQERSDKLQVFASFYVLEDFARQIGGDKVEVVNLTGNGDAHNFEISASQMAKLTKADLFIYIGGVDGWAVDIENSLTNADCFAFELDGGVDLTKTEDAHIWLNPDIAINQMSKLCDAFCAIDPQNAQYYKQNYAIAEEKELALEAKIKAAKEKTASHTMVVSHGAYGHLCKKLGMEQLAIEGIHGKGDPTPLQMAKVIDFIKENNIKYIFTSPNENAKSVQNVIAETGVELLELDPLDVDNNNGGYFSAMEKNITTIVNSINN